MRTAFLIYEGMLLALVMALCQTSPAAAQEGGPYPIWWSERLGLTSLDDIDAELDKPFAEDMTFWVLDLMRVSSEAIHAPNLSQRIEERAPELAPGLRKITSCRSLIRDMVRGFRPASTADHESFDLVSPRCYALQALKHARPARRSFVADFVLDENIRKNLTPMASRNWICLGFDGILQANEDGIAWQNYKFELHGGDDYEEKVLPADGDGVVIKVWWPELEAMREAETTEAHEGVIARGDFNGDDIEDEIILQTPERRPQYHHTYLYRLAARADFNDDGFEDLLLSIAATHYQGYQQFEEDSAIIVSRARAEGILRVVQILGPEDAGQRNCEREALSLPLPREAP